MKTIIIFLITSFTMLAQIPSVQTKMSKPAVGDVLTVYADIKPTNTSVLVEDLDPLKTNISSYAITLTNVTVSGDTTFGDFTLPVSETTQYLTIAVSKKSLNKKPSLLKTKRIAIDPRSTKVLFLDVVEK